MHEDKKSGYGSGKPGEQGDMGRFPSGGHGLGGGSSSSSSSSSQKQASSTRQTEEEIKAQRVARIQAMNRNNNNLSYKNEVEQYILTAE